jgi:hypothetical protein
MMLLLILRKQYKYSAIFLLIFLAVFLPWQIRNTNIPSEAGYIDQLLAKHPLILELGRANFFDFLVRAWNNFILYAFMLLPKMLASIILSKLIAAILGLIFIILIVTGFLKKTKRFRVIEIYVILSLVIILLWPRIWSSERFLLTIVPFFVFYVFGGLVWFARKIRFEHLMKLVIGILVLTNFVAIVLYSRGMIRANTNYLKGDRYAGYPDDWRNYFEVITWVNENIPDGNIIMARKPEFVYLLSRRKSLTYPITDDHNKVKKAIERCDYIIVDNFYGSNSARRWLIPVLKREQENYRAIHKTKVPEFALLEIIK